MSYSELFKTFYVLGCCVEIRAKIKKAGTSKAWDGWAAKAVAGYFDNAESYSTAAKALDDSGLCEAIYTSMNPVGIDLMARAHNRMVKAEVATKDEDITDRRFILLDFDPVRPAGISSSDAELAKAAERAKKVREHLSWPEPITAISGNGIHLLYPVALDNTVENAKLIEYALKALSYDWSDEYVELDSQVYSASRHAKLYGTVARKGDSIPGRPHRRSEIRTMPETFEPVPLEELLALQDAWKAREEAHQGKAHQNTNGTHWTPAILVQEAVEEFGHPGQRNHGGFELACQLRDQGYSEDEASQAMADYAARVGDDYDESEALSSMRQAYSEPAREPRAEPSNGDHRQHIIENYNRNGAVTGDLSALDGDAFPIIVTNNRQMREIVEDTLDAICIYNQRNPTEPILYVQGGILTRIATDENGSQYTKEARTPDVLYVMSQVADYKTEQIKVNKAGEEIVTLKESHPTIKIAQAICSVTEWPFPPLRGVVNCPTFARDGSLHAEQGYNPKTKLYNASDMALGDTEPTDENIDAAKSLIDLMLQDFPYVDKASKANAIGLLILQFTRELIDGATPIHATEASTPGTGKGLHNECIAYVGLGRWLPASQMGENDDEIRKRITSLLLMGTSHIHFDNVNKPVDSPTLASAVTQPFLSDRILGGNVQVTLAIRQIWMVNGNNLSMSDEIFRRTIFTRLDPNMERPDLRQDFAISDLRGWVEDTRSELVAACITLVRNWLNAGKPRFSGRLKGSYESWSKVIGGILESAGINHFLANEDEMFEDKVPTSSAFSEFVTQWAKDFSTEKVSTYELFYLASMPDREDTLSTKQWHGLLDEVIRGQNERGRRRSFGRFMKDYEDRVINDWKIICHGRSGGKTWYQLMEIDRDDNSDEGLAEGIGL